MNRFEQKGKRIEEKNDEKSVANYATLFSHGTPFSVLAYL